MTTVAGSQSWADFVDEVVTDAKEQSTEALAVVDEIALSEEPIKESFGGSALHKTGRCKPCAFFHTKGCQNDKNCQFCHLCPPGEKQRRKRLRERMCEKLGQCLQKPAAFDQVDQWNSKSGHRRQASGASLGDTSTQSTCSGWTCFSHSRESSSSSVAGSTGVVAAPMCGMPQMHQMMPVDASQMTARPLALAKVLPMPGQQGQGSPMAAAHGQMAPGGHAQWQHKGVVQYALVQVAVPMPQHQQHPADPSIHYDCYPQHPYSQQPCSQMAVVHDENARWDVQASANYVQPHF